MPDRVLEVVGIVALAVIVTLAMAAPVIRAPSERVFGMEIVGRHHDPFTVMAQFQRPITTRAYSQPVTDVTGAWLARLSGPIAAYNWVILLSFPLSAAAAYLLARHLMLSPAAAAVAAMAYAFSPFHVAHAAYHAHIAQTQWVPLYLLALWRCLDEASPRAVAFLGASTLAVTLSNFYGGFIAAVITPVAVAAYWPVLRRGNSERLRHVAITCGSLVLIAAAGMAYAVYAARGVVMDRAAFAFPFGDLFRYSTTWWGYLVPPVAHPWLGATAHRIWEAAGVREGLLEHQVSLGWGIVALALVAVYRRAIRDWQTTSGARVTVLAVVAVAALVCSLSPERTIGGVRFVRPAALLYDVLPMFRSYARFGVVVQLMAALLAGIGVDRLRRAGTTRAHVACFALLALAAGEYIVAPWALWRDVLPTRAHRWVMERTGRVQALDCTPLDQETEAMLWLADRRITLLGGPTDDCREPNLVRKLAAARYTHLIVRRGSAAEPWFGTHLETELHLAADFADARVFAITATTPPIHTATMTGFFSRENDAEWTWRWIEHDAAWTIINASSRTVRAALELELSALGQRRHLEVDLDGRPLQTLAVDPARRMYRVGPLTVSPGSHDMVFRSVEAPAVAGDVIHNGDTRRLSVALGTWNWDVLTEGE